MTWTGCSGSCSSRSLGEGCGGQWKRSELLLARDLNMAQRHSNLRVDTGSGEPRAAPPTAQCGPACEHVLDGPKLARRALAAPELGPRDLMDDFKAATRRGHA
jgi:hypothetical protein